MTWSDVLRQRAAALRAPSAPAPVMPPVAVQAPAPPRVCAFCGRTEPGSCWHCGARCCEVCAAVRTLVRKLYRCPGCATLAGIRAVRCRPSCFTPE